VGLSVVDGVELPGGVLAVPTDVYLGGARLAPPHHLHQAESFESAAGVVRCRGRTELVRRETVGIEFRREFGGLLDPAVNRRPAHLDTVILRRVEVPLDKQLGTGVEPEIDVNCWESFLSQNRRSHSGVFGVLLYPLVQYFLLYYPSLFRFYDELLSQ